METLKKCFDHTFFRFVFGFLLILGASFAVLLAVDHFGGFAAPEQEATFMETTASPDQAQDSGGMKSPNFQVSEQEISL